MNSSSTLLHPPWLNVARGLWIFTVTSALLVFVMGMLTTLDHLFSSCTTPEAVCGPWLISVEDISLARTFGLPVTFLEGAYAFGGIFPKFCLLGAGLLIFWRKSSDWVALLLSAMLAGYATEGVELEGLLGFLQAIIYAITTAIFFALPFIFPNGRFEPRWTRLLFPLLLAFSLPPSLAPGWVNSISPQLYAPWLTAGFLLWFIAAAYSALCRFRRVSDSIERQQTKWVVAGILANFVLIIPIIITFTLFPPTQPSPERLAFMYLVYLPINFVAYLFIPTAIAIAIFRYRLWDIDLIIRKTLTYALVAALLALVYFGSVIVLQQVFAFIIGKSSDVITVLSTLAIAALFVPLRNRLQAAIDKRFYRSKYDSQQVLNDFANTVRDETDLEKLTGRLIQVVDETMQPKSVSVWLKKDKLPHVR